MTNPYFPSVDPVTRTLREKYVPARLSPASLNETIEDAMGSMAVGVSPAYAAYNDTIGQLAIGIDTTALAAIVRGIAASAFTPASLTGLALWLDADDPATLFTDTTSATPAVAEAAVVACVADKSGNGRHATQATSGNRPALNRWTRNGRNAIYFDGTNDHLTTTLNPSTALTEGFSIFTVAKLDDTSSRTWSWLYGDGLSSTADGLYLGKKASVDQLTYAATSWHTGGDAGAGGFVGAWRQFGHQESDSVRRVLLDGTALTDTTNTNSSATTTAFHVGARPNSGEYWKGPIGELIVYNRVLTVAERQQVEGYLRGKWGTP